MDERHARISLACATEPGAPGIAAAVEEHGPVAVLAAIGKGPGLARTQQPGRLLAEDVPDMVQRMAQMGIRVLVPGDPEFPSQLLDLAEPPLALWVRGPLDLRAAALRSVAVVGARACTAYGERATGLLAEGLAQEGWAVVSGGAFGIDAAAHRAALGVEGPTIAVVACGVDVAYPRAHDALLCRIADTGAVVSELPPGSLPLKHRFLARNRLIAALSRGTVVVEAARRSGAIATANRAMEIGRVVMAVPGPVTSMASAGTNRLLHEQSARAVADHEEVVSLLLGAGADPLGADAPGGRGIGFSDPGSTGPTASGPGVGGPGSGGGAGVGSPGDGSPGVAMGPDARPVLEVLPLRGGLSVDAIAARSGVSPSQCLAQLGLLEIAGLSRRTRGGWCRSG